MSLTTLNVRMVPRRMLTEREAAEYLGVPIKRFQSLGISPIEILPGVKSYDMHDLDERIDLVKLGAGDPDEMILGRLA